MVEFIRAGGWVMFFILGVGLITLAAAARFAWRPQPGAVRTVAALSISVACSVGTGVSVDLQTVGFQVPARLEWAKSPDLPLIVLQGIAESLAPAVLGFSILSIAWLLMAVGQRRLGRQLG